MIDTIYQNKTVWQHSIFESSENQPEFEVILSCTVFPPLGSHFKLIFAHENFSVLFVDWGLVNRVVATGTGNMLDYLLKVLFIFF